MAAKKPPNMKGSPAGAKSSPDTERAEKHPHPDILGPFGTALQSRSAPTNINDPDALRARAASLRSKIPAYLP